ncbi:MAG: NYN domain-containing protein, partial [Candidatus Eremiobacteraeota bacterium]|nr:NYN domain-containing protein [Candidatus Eremiobacteraeota bacterium]
SEHPRPFPARASDDLLDAADEFTDLKDLAAAIELHEARRTPGAVSQALESERKRQQQQGFIRMLNRNGYQVVKKPVKVFADGNTKADLDIELAIDMLTLADRCERQILVSGDSDFVPVVRAVGMRGVRVEVVATQTAWAYNTSAEHPRPFPARASDDLLDAADEFTDLKDLAAAIELHEARRTAVATPQGLEN